MRHELLTEQIASLDWNSLQQELDGQGYTLIPELLDVESCMSLVDMYEDEMHFRSTIDMARYRFGRGEYKYFAAPLPPVMQELREGLYPELARTANRWMERLGQEAVYPAGLSDFLERCHRQGQLRPTPLILRYEAGGYNCLHQDLYGDVFFSFQVVIGLNRPDADYTGGEFMLVEQRPRAQSRGHVIRLEQGTGLIFPANYRPLQGARGYYRATLRHGVSTVQTGRRYSLGIIFHDAE